MAYKIHVSGFAKNRTVEGVLNAYTVLHPGCSIAQINKAFPSSIHHSGKPLLGTVKDYNAAKKTGTLVDDYMKISIHTVNGGKKSNTAYMLSMWNDDDTYKMAQYAKKADIDIEDFKYRKYFVPGSYSLRYLNGWKPRKSAVAPSTGGRKIAKSMIALLLLGLLLLFLLLFLLFRHLSAEKEEVQQEVEQVEMEFNAVQFEKAKYNLSEDAKAVLDKLSAVMLSHDKFSLRIEGHTSKEGGVDFNQTLSENRAKAAYEYLLSKGVTSDRVAYEGVGSTHPIDETQLAPNRRTEFIIDDGTFTFRGLWDDLVEYVKSFF
ncbi:MAG: OmpA family protein [Paludibacteraceae bacterium]|nr:OmpA family protein [Paludibacteraceae bacterium]